MYWFTGNLSVCSSRKSASRLICHIASSTTTTRARPSVTTVAVCCGVSTDRALNAKVTPKHSLFKHVAFFPPFVSNVISALFLVYSLSLIDITFFLP